MCVLLQVAGYANRSACCLRLGQPEKCVEDLCVAISLLEEKTLLEEERGDTAEMRLAENSSVGMLIKLLLRRAATRQKLGESRGALEDFEEAREEALAAASALGKQPADYFPSNLSLISVDEKIAKLKTG